MSSEAQGEKSSLRSRAADQPAQTDEPAEEILKQYQEDKWGSVNDLSEESTVKSYEIIDCTKRIRKYIEFDDEERIHELPVTQAERVNVESQYADLTAPDRNEFVPADFEGGTVDFARPETERVNTCSECGGNGRMRCGKCSGSGQNRCWRCNGSGTVSNNSKRCSSCGGSGTKVCSRCDGVGKLACETCEQKGETWKMDFIRREFTPQEETLVEEAPGVPDGFVTEADGDFRETKEETPNQNEIRRESDYYDVIAEKVDYVYDDKDYKLFRIDEENIKSKSYPKNQVRKILPYAVIAGIVVLGIILYLTGVV